MSLRRRCSSSFVVRRSSFVVRRSSFVVRRSSFVGRRSSFVVRRSSVVGRRSSVVVCRLLWSFGFAPFCAFCVLCVRSFVARLLSSACVRASIHRLAYPVVVPLSFFLVIFHLLPILSTRVPAATFFRLLAPVFFHLLSIFLSCPSVLPSFRSWARWVVGDIVAADA